MLCFVGCGLHTHGLLVPFTSYTNTTILANSPTCIAYWPLKEASDTVVAAEFISNNTGSYIDMNTTPALYPWSPFTLQNPPGPDVQSADAGMGSIAFAQPTIVAGDLDLRQNDPLPPACMVVNGCYVEASRNDKFIPKTSFTVEAWVRVGWDANATHAYRFVLDMRDFNPCTGFALFAKAEDDQPGVYSWGGIIGNGGSDITGFQLVGGVADPAITLSDAETPAGTTYYLAMTYDGPSQTATLFVDGEQRGSAVTSVVYVPNTTQPLWIGAGAPYVTRRPMQAAGQPGSPLFPFVGAIQNVAIYSEALKPEDITTHFNNGSGNENPGG
jgi:hypothetical protein